MYNEMIIHLSFTLNSAAFQLYIYKTFKSLPCNKQGTLILQIYNTEKHKASHRLRLRERKQVTATKQGYGSQLHATQKVSVLS